MATKEKPDSEKSSADLIALFEDVTPGELGVAQKKMFGWPSSFLNAIHSGEYRKGRKNAVHL